MATCEEQLGVGQQGQGDGTEVMDGMEKTKRLSLILPQGLLLPQGFPADFGSSAVFGSSDLKKAGLCMM